MVLPQTRYYSLMAALISICLTQETFATKRNINEIENPRESIKKRKIQLESTFFAQEDLENEPTFEEKTREEYKEEWGKLYKSGLERRKDFLSRNQSYRQCKTNLSRLEWVLTHQNNFTFKASLPMRNHAFLSELLNIKKDICPTLISNLRQEKRITDNEAAFFTSIEATKVALQSVKTALADKKAIKTLFLLWLRAAF
jgi:hypothetical protein